MLKFWKDKTRDPEGWIYKTHAEIYDETALSRKEQETARKIGAVLGIIEEKLSGKPATLHYRVNWDLVEERYLKYLTEINNGKLPFPAEKKKEKTTNSIAFLKDIPEEDIKELMEKFSVERKTALKCAQDVIDYCESHGKKYSDYKAAWRNFIKGHLERHPESKIKVVVPVKPATAPIADKPRTPEQQARVNAELQKIKDGLKQKFTMA